jgi:hypothetical protein
MQDWLSQPCKPKPVGFRDALAYQRERSEPSGDIVGCGQKESDLLSFPGIAFARLQGGRSVKPSFSTNDDDVSQRTALKPRRQRDHAERGLVDGEYCDLETCDGMCCFYSIWVAEKY